MAVILNRKALVGLNGNNGPLWLSDRGIVLSGGAGSARVLDDGHLIFQHLIDGGARLSILNVETGGLKAAELDERGEPRMWGCDFLVAGAGRWAAAGGWNAPAGYRDSLGHHEPDWMPLAIDDVTGQFLVSVFRGHSSTVNRWDGDRGILSPALYIGDPPGNGAAAAASDGLALVELVGRLVTMPQQAWPAFPIRNFAYSDGVLAGWHGTYRLVAWVAGASPMGYVLNLDESDLIGHDHNVDVKRQDNGHILVVTSRGPGEAPGELNRYDIDPIAKTVNGEHCADHVRPSKIAYLDLTAPLADAPSAAVPVLSFLPSPLAVGIWDDPEGPALTAVGWGNTERVFGVVCTVGVDDASRIEESSKLAQGRLWFLYRDARDYPISLVPHASGVVTIPMPQCNLQPGEPLAHYATEIRAVLRALRAKFPLVAASVRAYSGQNADGSMKFTEQQLIDAAVLTRQIAIEEGLCGIEFFCYDRADGLRRLPSLTATIRAMQKAATVGWPAPLVHLEDDMLLPKLNPDNFEPYWEFPDHVVVKNPQAPEHLRLHPDSRLEWVAGKENKGPITNPKALLSSEAFAWKPGEPIAVAIRNGLRFELPVITQ